MPAGFGYFSFLSLPCYLIVINIRSKCHQVRFLFFCFILVQVLSQASPLAEMMLILNLDSKVTAPKRLMLP